MLRKLIPLLLISFAIQSYAAKPSFESSEHITAGDSVNLSFAYTQPAKTHYALQLPNGLKLTYGELVALGDFYGIPEKPISFGKNDADKKARFIAAFNTLAQNPTVGAEVEKILAVMYKEKRAVEQAIEQGQDINETYKKMSNQNNCEWNCITGGGCSPSNWFLFPGRYLQLAKNDFDHFGDNALIAYQAGHQVALDEAIAAHATNDLKRLELAYAMNAFANHYLSDRFSAGHIRTPRLELTQHVTPSTIGSALSGYMHGEENELGFHVHNKKGEKWLAYGDKLYLHECNKINRAKTEAILQISADEIFYAYQFGTAPSSSVVTDLIPEPNELGNASAEDIAPLFYWDEKSKNLYRRTNMASPFDRRWTTNWWGWSTLLQLAKERGLPLEVQADLAMSGYSKKALADGLITNKEIIKYIRANNN